MIQPRDWSAHGSLSPFPRSVLTPEEAKQILDCVDTTTVLRKEGLSFSETVAAEETPDT
jgi:hypothetical protein